MFSVANNLYTIQGLYILFEICVYLRLTPTCRVYVRHLMLRSFLYIVVLCFVCYKTKTQYTFVWYVRTVIICLEH